MIPCPFPTAPRWNPQLISSSADVPFPRRRSAAGISTTRSRRLPESARRDGQHRARDAASEGEIRDPAGRRTARADRGPHERRETVPVRWGWRVLALLPHDRRRGHDRRRTGTRSGKDRIVRVRPLRPRPLRPAAAPSSGNHSGVPRHPVAAVRAGCRRK